VTGELTREPQAFGPDDADQLLRGAVKFLINNNIIEFAHMRNLPARCRDARRNDLSTVLTASAKPLAPFCKT